MKGIIIVQLLAIVALANAKHMYKHGVSCDERKIIIDKHNELRTKIATGSEDGQPKSSNMQKLVWDDSLAKTAQAWADHMKFEHNANRGKGEDRFAVGENIFMSFSHSTNYESDWAPAVQDWYDEVKDYSFGAGFDPNTGHYTQVVWAKTTHVGCGFTAFKEDGTTKKLYVCDYGPAGNYPDETPYEEGAGCEDLCCKDQCASLYSC